MTIRRTVASTLGVLVAGAMTVPLTMGVASADHGDHGSLAGNSVTLKQDYLCIFAPPGQPREETEYPIEAKVTVDNGKVDVELSDMPNFPRMPDIFTWQTMSVRAAVTLNAETDVWSEGTLQYEGDTLLGGLAGSTPELPMPSIHGTYDPAIVDAHAVSMGNLKLMAEVNVGDSDRLYPNDINCELRGSMDFQYLALQNTNADCIVTLPGGAASTYRARVTTAVAAPARGTIGRPMTFAGDTKVLVDGGLSGAVTDTDFISIAADLNPVLAVGGKTASAGGNTATWNRKTGGIRTPKGESVDKFIDFAGATAAQVTPTAAGDQTAVLSGFKGEANFVAFGGVETKGSVDCILDESKNLGSVPVFKPLPVATNTSVFTKYAKKAKTAKVSVVVSGKASGKAKAVVIKGKKKITRNLTIKNGKASFTLKKASLKKKGTYTVKVNFIGNDKFKSSVRTVTFRVR